MQIKWNGRASGRQPFFTNTWSSSSLLNPLWHKEPIRHSLMEVFEQELRTSALCKKPRPA